MFIHAVVNEFLKMRRIGALSIAAALLTGIPIVTFVTAIGSGMFAHLRDPDGYGWKLLLACVHTGVSFAAPLLISVMAGRQVEVEHTGGGWLAHAGIPLAPGAVVRVKFVALVCLLLPVMLFWYIAIVFFGWFVGIVAPVPAERFYGCAFSVIVIVVIMLAFQLVVSAFSDSQLVPIGVGLCGTVLATFGQLLPRWLLYFTPWTYFVLAEPADFVGLQLVYLDYSYLSMLLLGVGGGILFLCTTVILDRREV